jgi:hypothetical protein
MTVCLWCSMHAHVDITNMHAYLQLITSPPLYRCVSNGKPWFLLVPNYVYMKDYYEACLRGGSAGSMIYVCPPSRYLYESPKGVANALGEVRKSGERKTAPFMSFWYVGADSRGRELMLKSWKGSQSSSQGQDACTLCKGVHDLPHAMRDSFDPLRKVCGISSPSPVCVYVCVRACVRAHV